MGIPKMMGPRIQGRVEMYPRFLPGNRGQRRGKEILKQIPPSKVTCFMKSCSQVLFRASSTYTGTETETPSFRLGPADDPSFELPSNAQQVAPICDLQEGVPACRREQLACFVCSTMTATYYLLQYVRGDNPKHPRSHVLLRTVVGGWMLQSRGARKPYAMKPEKYQFLTGPH